MSVLCTTMRQTVSYLFTSVNYQFTVCILGLRKLVGEGYVDVDSCIGIALYHRCHRSVVDTVSRTFYLVRFNTNAVTLDCHSRILGGREKWRY